MSRLVFHCRYPTLCHGIDLDVVMSQMVNEQFRFRQIDEPALKNIRIDQLVFFDLFKIVSPVLNELFLAEATCNGYRTFTKSAPKPPYRATFL
ncbi:MAG: hypothetical protein ACI4JA_06370 [Oscillospiraceae bacterium]